MSRITKFAVATTAALAAVGLLATSAVAAAPTYTVKAGTKTSGTSSYSAKTKKGTTNAPAITLDDTTSNLTLGCISGTAKGVFQLGSGLPGAAIASITGTTWNTCSGPLGLVLVPKQTQTWTVNAKTKTTAAGITKGSITNIKATLTSSPDPSQCSFTVTGAVDISYANSSGKLSVAPVSGSSNKLTISGVSGCFGLISNNDNATFTSSYTVTTPTGKVSITSP